MKIEKVTYPDGSFYPKIISVDAPMLMFRINSYSDLYFLRQIKDALDNMRIGNEVRLTIPCLLDAQADQRFEPNQSFNLKMICEDINKMNWKSVRVFHPHNPEVVNSLIDHAVMMG